jgi:2-methylisocitrate lyase-like PEP mutase family enzyme
MNTQKEKATAFHKLHVKGSPVILFNCWDAGSARIIEEAGAKAIATSSWAVAVAHGFEDREKTPFDLAIANLERVVKSVGVPVTIDLEGGYATDHSKLKENIEQVIAAGAVGINFEDQIIGGKGLHTIEDQAARIRIIRETAEKAAIPLFINARTDVFLWVDRAKHDEVLLDETVRRGVAYAEAGASGLFAPGLENLTLIEKLCELSPLPVNILALPDIPPVKTLAQLGVARVSYGSRPYRQMSEFLKEAARKAFSD